MAKGPEKVPRQYYRVRVVVERRKFRSRVAISALNRDVAGVTCYGGSIPNVPKCHEFCEQDIAPQPLPKNWPAVVRSAVFNVIGVGRVAILAGRKSLSRQEPIIMLTAPLLTCCFLSTVMAAPAERLSYVDQQGVLRWRDDDSEIALFGVNYYAPFTVDHLGIETLGLDHRSVIEQDVAHFQRLGLDAIRLHVFDRQISDRQGNLIANRHLELFDYLVWQCKNRGIYTVLTPIAWWQCPDRWRAGTPLPVQVVIAAADIQEVLLHGSRSGGIMMKTVEPYSYGTTIPGDELAGGVCSLRLEVIRATETEPSATGNGKEIELLPANSPVPLFVADHQQVRLEGQVDRRSKMVAGSHPDRRAVQVSVGSFEPAPAAVHFRNVVPPYMSAWHDALAECNAVVLTARALTEDTDRLELVLLEKDTAPWGTEVPLTTQWQEIVVPLDRLRFFSHWSHPAQRGGEGNHFDPQQVNAVNICFGAWLYGPRSSKPHGFEIESILLDRRDLDKAD